MAVVENSETLYFTCFLQKKCKYLGQLDRISGFKCFGQTVLANKEQIVVEQYIDISVHDVI